MRFRVSLCLLLLMTCVADAQDAQYRFSHLGSSSGLSSINTTAVLTDQRGFTWIGTDNGLNCFDGIRCETFFHKRDDPHSLPNNTITCLAEEQNGVILVGTSFGIARLNPWNKKFALLTFADSSDHHPFCTECYVDNMYNVWCWSQDILYRLNPISGQLESVFACDNKSGHPDRISSFYRDRAGNNWLCSRSGLCLLSSDFSSVQIFPGTSGEPFFVISAYEDAAGNLWCGSWGSGVLRFHSDNKSFEQVMWNESPDYGGADNIVINFRETKKADGSMQLWTATNKGLAVIVNDESLHSNDLIFVPHDPNNPQSPASDYIGRIYTNRLNQLWVPGSDGVSLLLPEIQSFRKFAPDVTGSFTKVLNEDNAIFVATWYGQGLQKMDRSGQVLFSWKHTPATVSVNDAEQVSDVYRANDHSLWVSTFGGLFHGDSSGNNFEPVPLPPVTNAGSQVTHATCVAEDYEGNIWCGTYGKGVVVFNRAWKNPLLIANNDSVQPLPANLIWQMRARSNGELWLATNGGIAIQDPASEVLHSFRKIKAGADSILLTICSNLYEDKHRTMWVCTNEGLAGLRTDSTWIYLDRENGLPGNTVNDICEDHRGNLWATTNGGLALIDSNAKVVSSYTYINGLPPGNLSVLFSLGNNMVVGSAGSLYIFSPDAMIDNTSIPSLFFTSVKTGTRTVNITDNPDGADSLELSWDDNVMSFDFVSPGWHTLHDVLYEYRLLGSNEEWTQAQDRNFASYAGLSPGHYVFEARASFRGGNWSKVISYGFTIKTPYWKSWWFLVLCGGALFAATVFAVRRESMRKVREQLLRLEKQQAVESERNRISKDMHDDLGSGLTKIAILSEVVRQKIGSGVNPQQQVDTISESARNLVDNLNEIIWALNPGNDNLRNLASYIREYSTNYMESCNLHFECVTPDDLPELELSEQHRRFLFLVIKETLHNIVKHASASHAALKMHIETDILRITIFDNGIGLPAELMRSGVVPANANGLRNMRLRMEAIGGKYTISSREEKGTLTRLIFPLHH